MIYLKYLKPCPFCGSPIEKTDLSITKIGCSKLNVECSCGASFTLEPKQIIEDGFFSSKLVFEDCDAVELWNRRANNA